MIERNEYDALSPLDRDPPQPVIEQQPPSTSTTITSHVLKNSGFSSAFLSGLGTIWATEVGDKTFFIAAILSMRHDRLVVFFGAIGGRSPTYCAMIHNVGLIVFSTDCYDRAICRTWGNGGLFSSGGNDPLCWYNFISWIWIANVVSIAYDGSIKSE